ncbi:NAD(P)H-binding protein [Roseibium sp. RKSG952]|uniref:NAD(P)H-binding protein n=1 Tax=Roseibium sp. RKSG952 TaxID=2529384 RepID=UPI0034CFE90D
MHVAKSEKLRVLLFGATGTIGRAALRAMQDDGHEIVCALRPGTTGPADIPGARTLQADVTNREALFSEAFSTEHFDAVVSCMASRTGMPNDAWAIDCHAHLNVLKAAEKAGVGLFVLLSAICVQKPRLQFHFAKLAFEKVLKSSAINHVIVRPTAYFKSLSGQVARVKAGKPFLVFGNGRATMCMPISDDDLGRYLADCLTDPSRLDRTLPIGGPGPAITPMDQGICLFEALGRKPHFRHVPLFAIKSIAKGLGLAGTVLPALADKAEFARIGAYYATESMLVYNPETGHYDADATPSFGTETLCDHYDALLAGRAHTELGAHRVFK